MNAHQRRKASRRRHMLLPLGKEVVLGRLLNRRVYVYGAISDKVILDANAWHRIASATVHRHVKPSNGGGIDLRLVAIDGKEVCINTSMRGIVLVNPADRAIRPWWCNQRRRSA